MFGNIIESGDQESVLRLEKVSKIYGEKVPVEALKRIDLSIAYGAFVAITGPSGSGKSTLMHIVGCLLRPTSGEVIIENIKISDLTESELARIRGRKVGFVFQEFNLLSRMDALRNVALPLSFQNVGGDERNRKARQVLEDVGLGHRLDHNPTELSGGQKQRVAIARALISDPAIILADEPTGNLDTETGKEIMKIFKDLNDRGRTIVMVTHESHIAAWANSRVHLVDGRVVSQGEDFKKELVEEAKGKQ